MLQVYIQYSAQSVIRLIYCVSKYQEIIKDGNDKIEMAKEQVYYLLESRRGRFDTFGKKLRFHLAKRRLQTK